MNENDKPAPKTWGVSSAEFYTELRNKSTQIITLDSKIYKGVLRGVDLYDIVLEQSNGVTILLPKHAIKLIQADTPIKNG